MSTSNKKKVMDDLDSLLADLQSTTTSQQKHQHGDSSNEKRASNASCESPPPLPPPPSHDIINSLHESYDDSQPLYEVQHVRHPPSVRTLDSPDPPVHSAHVHSSTALSAPRVQPIHSVQPQAKHMSTLSSNLSELDTLLQDLSSAQFITDVDRRNVANVYQEIPARQGPPTLPKPVCPAVVNTMPNDTGAMQQPLMHQTSMSNYEEVHIRQTNQGGAIPQMTPLQIGGMSPQMGGLSPQIGGMSPQMGGMSPQMGGMSPGMSPGQPAWQPQPAPSSVNIGAASSATKELDDLMASLSEFQVTAGPPQHVGEPPYAQPMKLKKMNADTVDSNNLQQQQHQQQVTSSVGVSGNTAQLHSNNNLDAMLGNLHSDMSRQGVNTVPKGHCAACAKPIVGQVITALGKIWHPEHFSCVHCKLELGTCNFFERDGHPYCEVDYQNLFSPRCAQCQGPILDQCVTALDTTWHPEHFVCAQCGRPFGDDGFHERDGKAYCKDDYFHMFAPKCACCSRAIMNNFISALGRQWHPECFVCQECHMPFGASSFYDHEGLPYCETHYHARRGSLCASCQKPITGRCITAMHKKFHPEHFVCAFCLKQLNKGTFKEQNDKPYCHPCFVKLFG